MDPLDFSLWALFSRASAVVQLVFFLLLAGSVWSWAVTLQKSLTFARAKSQARRFESRFWSGEPLDKLYEEIDGRPKSAPERIFVTGMEEWQRSHKPGGGLIPGASARIDRSLDVALARQAGALECGLSFLGTIGATAPFVGLFGTVWGIKNSFEEIALMQNTNLAVVAPGIAEALMATAVGLLTAIPAVIFYNRLTAESGRLVARYEAFADEFATLLSRELSREGAR
ncbi:MAG: protein TolQ [Mangrovicoccus sp.]